MKIFQSLAAWLSPLRREKIQAAVTALAPLLVGAGLVTEGDAGQWLQLVGAAGQIGAALLSLVHLSPAAAAEWFTTAGRAALYAAVLSAATAATVLGFLDQEAAARVVSVASLGLGALSALVSVAFLTPSADGTGPSRPARVSS